MGQESTFFLSGATTGVTSTALFLNGDTAKTVIPRLTDVLYGYTIDVFSYRTGGTSGTGAVGDRGFFKVQGLTVGSGNDEGVTTATAYIGTDMFIKVTGLANMDISWGAVAKFYQMKI